MNRFRPSRRPSPLLPAALLGVSGLLAGAADPSEVTRLAVIDLEPNGVPSELARALTETVATRVDGSGVFETVSPVQLAAIIALDKAKWASGGGCVEEDCFAKLARAVAAEHAIGGSVARAGSKLALQLVLVEVGSAKAIERVEREADDPAELLTRAGEAAIQLIQPVLSERSGFARIDSNVPGAQLVLDGERSPHRVGQVFTLAAGPHVVKASMDGFFPTTVDLNVRPSRVSTARLTLVPAPETVAAYEAEANLMRSLAWVTAGVAVASGIASGFFYDQAGQNLEEVDAYVGATDLERQGLERPTGARSDFDTNQGLYLTFLGTAVVSGLSSAALFIFGPDPDRFAEFDDYARSGD